MRYNYIDDVVLGHSFEDKFVQFLISKGVNPDWIEQAPTDVAFHDWDIKVHYPVLYNEWGELIDAQGYETYEIKRDRVIEKTGNICIETMSCKEKNTLGWWQKTKAQYLVIFDTDNSFYTMKMEDVRYVWIHAPQAWKKKEIPQDAGYHTTNWICSVMMIPHKRIQL